MQVRRRATLFTVTDARPGYEPDRSGNAPGEDTGRRNRTGPETPQGAGPQTPQGRAQGLAWQPRQQRSNPITAILLSGMLQL